MRQENKPYSEIRILYLCEKSIYLRKTSRVRFHAVEAIAKQCELIMSGPGWEGWDNGKTLDENIVAIYGEGVRPDLVFCYKPFNIKGFSKTKIPTCVSYNEMGTTSHPRSYTVKEIMENHVDLVICHHRNEMEYPEFAHLPSRMVNIAHCVEKSIFRDYQLPKKIDVLLVGAIHPGRYPFRTRLSRLILEMRQDPAFSAYSIGTWNHPGGRFPEAYNNEQVKKYAQEINRTKICLTCSGRYRSRYGKYSEIPACRSLLMGDLPDEDHDFFRQFMAVIDMADSDRAIKEKILYYLEHDAERQKLADLGYELTQKEYTMEDYAERFLNAVRSYLIENQGQKLPFWSQHD